MIIDNFQFVDLGLPSGRLWAAENVKNKNGVGARFTFDVAVETFGKNLPSNEDWKELFDNCSYKWNNKKKGFDITGSNGNSIFLPAAGYRHGLSVYDVGIGGHYWSSSVSNENCADSYADSVDFYGGDLYPQGGSYRYDALSIRLVR